MTIWIEMDFFEQVLVACTSSYFAAMLVAFMYLSKVQANCNMHIVGGFVLILFLTCFLVLSVYLHPEVRNSLSFTLVARSIMTRRDISSTDAKTTRDSRGARYEFQ